MQKSEEGVYDAVELAVGDRECPELVANRLRAFTKPDSVLYDLKYVLPSETVDMRL